MAGPPRAAPRRWQGIAFAAVVAALILYLAVRAAQLLATLPLAAWGEIAAGLGATLLRVCAALALAAAWTIPLGVAVGMRPRLAAVLQPIAQIAASVPATALFPVMLLGLLRLPGGLDLSAVLLMLLGTQWYLLFNVIAGATAIPQDLRDTASLLRLPAGERWKTLLLPALFPFAITGAITAVGGAWSGLGTAAGSRAVGVNRTQLDAERLGRGPGGAGGPDFGHDPGVVRAPEGSAGNRSRHLDGARAGRPGALRGAARR